jgi:hypothetical protein
MSLYAFPHIHITAVHSLPDSSIKPIIESSGMDF